MKGSLTAILLLKKKKDKTNTPFGVVFDMWTEKANDGVKYRRIADQSDFDKF